MGYLSAEVKSMKEWALYYAELGLAVFPLAYRNKVPAIEGGCKAATTEKSKIERWWNQNPRYNIGIATGNKSNGLVVIDLDVDKNKGIDGYEVLRDWQNKHGELPETWQSITGTDIMMICSRRMIYIHGDFDRKTRCRKGKGPD